MSELFFRVGWSPFVMFSIVSFEPACKEMSCSKSADACILLLMKYDTVVNVQTIRKKDVVGRYYTSIHLDGPTESRPCLDSWSLTGILAMYLMNTRLLY
jgi:hypothetical protein